MITHDIPVIEDITKTKKQIIICNIYLNTFDPPLIKIPKYHSCFNMLIVYH